VTATPIPPAPPTASDPGLPTLEQADGVATVRLRRPAERNRLHDADLHALRRIFEQVEADPSVRVMVLTADTTGQPRPVFSAGYHVGGFERADHDPRLFESVPDAIERLRPITVCALNGSVYGGATDMVLACDLRVAVAGCEFRMPANALGLHYYPHGLRRYVACLGLAMAQRAFLTASPLPVETLALTGAFEVVGPAQAFEEAVRLRAEAIAALAPRAVQATKRSLQEIAAGRFDPAVLREREAMTLASEDFAEGRAAFAQRRTPRFTGR
jgi:enoyl-CoA hydratase/carnithine racemase